MAGWGVGEGSLARRVARKSAAWLVGVADGSATCQIPGAGVRVPCAAGAGAPHPHDGKYALMGCNTDDYSHRFATNTCATHYRLHGHQVNSKVESLCTNLQRHSVS